MSAGIFILQGDTEGVYLPISDGTKMIIPLCDYNDSKHLRFVTMNITSELPPLIRCDGRWYSNHASWDEVSPEGERNRCYYRQTEGYEPDPGIRTFEAKMLVPSTSSSVRSVVEALHKLWKGIIFRA